MTTDIDQPTVGDRLPRETRPTCSEADRHPLDLRSCKDRLDLLLGPWLHDRLGYEQVRTCVVGEGIALPCLGEDIRTGPVEVHEFLAVEELFDRIEGRGASGPGDRCRQRNLLRADRNAVLGVAASLNASGARERFESLFLKILADRV